MFVRVTATSLVLAGRRSGLDGARRKLGWGFKTNRQSGFRPFPVHRCWRRPYRRSGHPRSHYWQSSLFAPRAHGVANHRCALLHAKRKAARSDSATPSKLSNPGNHCWFNAIAQSLAATIATARTPSCSCSVMPDTHVERVLTILCQHGHVPSELKEAAIKDVVVERSKVEKARGRRGFVGHVLSVSGFGRKFGTDFTEHAQDIDIGLAKCILAAAGPKNELSAPNILGSVQYLCAHPPRRHFAPRVCTCKWR